MYIKSIVLDGFKSYGNRVEITGFDPEFTAITGLNGTGKSNILDSICFVLGITNLSNVRASSLQELIYKNGQAGITKATVSITFDNSNRNQQPIGYDCQEITVTRQVVMGGKNKYMINGNNVQNKRVSDLFCSVQLNVNNPHFLIMQGRITKVLNMKPPEILSMVEEAAGTRMYEAKKLTAQKIIDKKDAKLRELNAIVEEDIAPKLEKLHEERAQFQEYQKVVREVETLNKLYIAWKYVTAEGKTKDAEDKVQKVKDAMAAKKESIKESEKEIQNIDKEVAQINKALDEESGSVLKELESELVQLEKCEAGSGAAVKGAREAVDAHQRRLAALERALKDDAAVLKDKEQQLDQVSGTFESLRTASEAAEQALADAQQKFLAVSTGQENASESLQDQLMAAKQEASEAGTRVSAATMEKKHAETRLRTLQQEFRAGAAQFARDRDAIERHQQELDDMQAQLSRMNFDNERNSMLRESVRALQSGVRAARDAHDSLAARLQRCNFHYTPPPGFDRSAVAGTVCRLFTVKEATYCTALETAAGGKLYNVVVDTEVTSKLLLQRGNLQTRTTIIPLNKISSHVIDAATVRLAQEIGGGPDKVQLALDLISFEERLRPALAWVFGNTLVCRDLETAKRVTFHPRVRRRAVTLDGDVFDPQGTLSGGARQQGGSVLAQLSELRAAEATLAAQEAALARDTHALQRDQRIFDDYHALQQQFEIKSHELEVVKSRLANTTHAQLHDEICALEAQVKALTEAVERDRVTQREAAARAHTLQDKVKDIKGHREREFKKAEAELKRARKEAEEHGARWRGREQELEGLRLEVAELRRAVSTGEGQRAGEGRAGEDARERLKALQEEHSAHVDATKVMRARIERQKAEMAARSGAVRKQLARKEALARGARDDAHCLQQLALDVADLQAEADRCQKERSALEKEHTWIPSEREYFGAAGGLYDFEARGAATAGARLRSLTTRRDALARGLNARAHTLLHQQEEQHADLMRRKRMLERDRAKMVDVIAELDEKKRTTLIAACAQVNKDFGSMFSTLLPGAQAKLQPPPGKEVLDGLEVCVGFNGTWKESLSELSGGQRSLVALSLVLAMLLFKPAPLYILDEVDAALDLSHTQNIGAMLTNHFKHSQFIIVSLKDGMFNNANVLFRTKFVDGMSSVQRVDNTKR